MIDSYKDIDNPTATVFDPTTAFRILLASSHPKNQIESENTYS